MPYILKNKKTEQFSLFGSLPVLCRSIGFDGKNRKKLLYIFSQKKESIFETMDYLIVKVVLFRGGKEK